VDERVGVERHEAGLGGLADVFEKVFGAAPVVPAPGPGINAPPTVGLIEMGSRVAAIGGSYLGDPASFRNGVFHSDWHPTRTERSVQVPIADRPPILRRALSPPQIADSVRMCG